MRTESPLWVLQMDRTLSQQLATDGYSRSGNQGLDFL